MTEPRLDQLPARLASKAATDARAGCWLWTATLTTSGYGQVWFRGRVQSAHRVAYELLIGPIPDGLELDHLVDLCGHRNCINPRHLEPVTHRINTLRGSAPSAINARKTHCKRGHELNAENTVVRVGPNGVGRQCRACQKLRNQRRSVVGRLDRASGRRLRAAYVAEARDLEAATW